LQHSVLFGKKEVLLRSKNLLALFGCAKKPFCSFGMDQFFPFVANELQFVVITTFIGFLTSRTIISIGTGDVIGNMH
jgi:hypothetical protein